MDIDNSSYYVGVLREHGVDGIVILDRRDLSWARRLLLKDAISRVLPLV